MRKPSTFFLAIALSFLSVTAVESQSTGPWLEAEDDWFRYVYKKADEPFLANVMEAAGPAYETATGYLGRLAEEKPIVILYGEMDEGTWGGYCSPIAMRIGLAANAAQSMNYRSTLTHELTHYLQAESRTGGALASIVGFFGPDFDRGLSLALSDLSLEGSTSFIDGYRMCDWSTLPLRAAVLEGRMWDYDKVSTASLRQPGVLRVYLSGMLIQEWLRDNRGDDALAGLLAERDRSFAELESDAFKRYTGVDFEIAWGEIRAGLERRYAFARALPRGEIQTPKDSRYQPQWLSLTPTDRGYFHARVALDAVPSYGFWVPENGAFIRLEGIATGDATVSADGNSVAVVVNQPAKSNLYQAPNENELFVGAVRWSPDGKSARAETLRKVPGRGYSSPALSPDGARLFALVRESDMYRAVEINPATGEARRLSIPDSISVESMSVSRDGKRIALSYCENCSYDVGLYDLKLDTFTAVTKDDAMDFAARFLDDGSLAFSSDRENTVEVYRYDGKDFYREIVDAVAAFSPSGDGEGGYYYSSFTTDGRAILRLRADRIKRARVDGFASLKPDWIARRDGIWEAYRAKGKALAENAAREASLKGRTRNGFLASQAKRYIDVPYPIYWAPSLAYGPEGGHFGASAFGTGKLEELTWNLGLGYIPEHAQLDGNLGINVNLPSLSLSASIAESYYGMGDGPITWVQARLYAVGAEIPIALRVATDGTGFSLSATASAAARERIQSAEPFTFPDSVAFRPEWAFTLAGGLTGAVFAQSPQTAFLGGSGIALSVEGALRKPEGTEPIAPGCLAKANAKLLASPGMRLSLGAKAAYLESGAAHYLLPRDVERWERDSAAPFHGELGLEISSLDIGPERARSFIMNERAGICLGAKTFMEADTANGARWIKEADFNLDLIWNVALYYANYVAKLGVGYRMDIDRPVAPSASDFCLRLTFAGYDLRY